MNFIAQLFPLAVGIFTIPVLIRGLGLEGFGVLTFCWVVVGYFGIFDLGLGQATTKFGAELITKGQGWRIPNLAWTVVALQIALGAAAGLTLTCVTPLLVGRILNLPIDLAQETRVVFYILAASLPIILVSGAFKGILAATQRFDLVNAVQMPSSVATYAIPAVSVGLGLHLPGIVLLISVSRLITALAYFTFCVRLFPSLTHTIAVDRKLIRPLVGYGGWLTISSLIGPVMASLDRLLIATFISMEAVAYYAAPYEVVTRLSVLPASLTAALFPAFSALAVAGRRRKQDAFLAASSKFLLLVLGPIIVAILAFHREILEIWLGLDFSERSGPVFFLLASGMLVNSLTWLPVTLLQATGRPDIPPKLHLVELPLYALLTSLLIKRSGIAGAALAWAIRVAVDGCLMWSFAFRLNGLRFASFVDNGVVRTVVLVGGLAGTLLGVSALIFPMATRVGLAAALFLGFGLLAWTYALQPAEKEYVMRMIGHLIRSLRTGGRSWVTAASRPDKLT